uniref:cadherin-like beta sandwich domain-containing protein n=1 Tax=Alistipes putredinis TaxID=28117 RepID=UPI003AAA6333
MKQYTSLWLVCLLAVFSMTARAQEGIETKARPDYPALPFMLTFEAPAEGSASLSISADGETLTSPTTLHSGTEVTITVTPADGYRMASGYPKVYRTGTPSETVPATFKPDASSGIAYLYTFTMPDFPVTVEVEFEKIQSTVTFANPANGTLTLSTADASGTTVTPIASGDKIVSGTRVTIAATPAASYQMVFGSLKVSGKVGNETKTVPLQKVADGTTYFFMPAYAVTAEVKFEPIPVVPSSEARLSSLSYKVGNEAATPLPGFLASTMKYEVLLPSSTLESAALTLSGQLADAKAKLFVNGSLVPVQSTGSFTATVSLVDGSAKATLVVTAEDGQTKRTYEVNFTVAPQPVCYVTIQQPEGGTISVSYKKEGKEVVVKSGDAVPQNIELNLANTALQNYEFKEYSVDGFSQTAETVNIGTCLSKTITAAFTQESSVTPEEIA